MFERSDRAGEAYCRAAARRGVIVAFVLGLLSVLSGPALGQQGGAARIEQLNKQAMDDYDMLEFDAAEKKLLAALAVARRAKISDGPALAATYVYLGIVYGAGQNNAQAAVKYFIAALKLDRSLRLDPTRATPALEEMFKQAQERVGPAPPRITKALRHSPVDQGEEGEAVPIQAELAAGLDAARCVLHYRPPGHAAYERIVLRREGRRCSGAIPAWAVKRPSLHYYLDVLDKAGRRLPGSGSGPSPHVVTVRGDGAAGRTTEPTSEPSETPPTTRPVDGQPQPAGDHSWLSLSLMVGTGAGIVFGGTSEHAHLRVSGGAEKVDIKPGGAPAPFHLALEAAYHLGPAWQIGALVRLQLVNAISSGLKNKPSALGELRAKRYFGEGPLRYYLSFGAGGGQIRHRIPLGDYDHEEDPDGSLTPNDRVDTRVAGVAAFGFGGGLQYMFTRVFGLVIDLNGLILVPDFAAHLDFGSGLLVSF